MRRDEGQERKGAGRKHGSVYDFGHSQPGNVAGKGYPYTGKRVENG